MAHKYYLCPGYQDLYLWRIENNKCEIISIGKNTREWHKGNIILGNNLDIITWNLKEISLEETIQWLLDRSVNNILKEILQQYIDENYKCQ